MLNPYKGFIFYVSVRMNSTYMFEHVKIYKSLYNHVCYKVFFNNFITIKCLPQIVYRYVWGMCIRYEGIYYSIPQSDLCFNTTWKWRSAENERRTKGDFFKTFNDLIYYCCSDNRKTVTTKRTEGKLVFIIFG